jgi:glutaminyl-tRNA synthetase
VIEEKPDERCQFERDGYFYADPVAYSDEAPVFNRIVTLKDSWAKKQKAAAPSPKPEAKQPKAEPKRKAKPAKAEEGPMAPEEKARFESFTRELGLQEVVASILARDEVLAAFFEEALASYKKAENIAKLVANEVARELKKGPELSFAPVHVAQLAKMLDEERISTKIAKEVFEAMAERGEAPEKIVADRGLEQISDPEALRPVVERVVAEHPGNVKKYREGNERLFGFFVGQVLKATGGKANPRLVNELLGEALKGA